MRQISSKRSATTRADGVAVQLDQVIASETVTVARVTRTNDGQVTLYVGPDGAPGWPVSGREITLDAAHALHLAGLLGAAAGALQGRAARSYAERLIKAGGKVMAETSARPKRGARR